MRFDIMEAEEECMESKNEEEEEEEGSSGSDDESSDGEDEDGSEGEDWESDSGSDSDGLPVDQAQSSTDDDDSVDKCPVCLKRLRDQMIGMPESCDHDFCLDCLREWATNVNTCPIDRQIFRLILVKRGVEGVIQRRIPVEDKQIETEDAPIVDVTNCEICERGDREDRLLLCDSCDLGFHLDCLTPALNRVPRGDWFCPQCVQAVPQEGRAGVLPRLQMLARTPVVMRVRAAIRRLRIVSDSEDNDEDDDDGQMMAASGHDVEGRPSTSTPRKRKTKRKKRKSKSKRSVKKTVNTSSSGKTTGKRKKRRRRRKKKKARTKSTKSSTTKSRIADRLGIKKPAPGSCMPRVKTSRSESSMDMMRTDSGISLLSILGERDELPYFSDSENDDFISHQQSSSGVALASRSSYSLNHHQAAKRMLSKSAASVSSASLGRSVSQPPYEAVTFDLLGNILAGQKKLLTNSKAVKILRDGSLDASTATPQDGDGEQSPPPPPPSDAPADSTTNDRSETTSMETASQPPATEAANSGSSSSEGGGGGGGEETAEVLYDPFNPDSDSEKDEQRRKKQRTEVSTSAIQPGDVLSIDDDEQGMDGEDVMIEIIEEEEEVVEEEPAPRKELYDPFEEDDGKRDEEAARGVSEAEADSTAEQATVSAPDEEPTVKEERAEAVVGSTSEPDGDSSQSSDTKDARRAVTVPSSEADLEGSRHRNSTPSVDKDSKVKEEGYFKWEWEKSAGAEVDFKSGRKSRDSRDDRRRSRESKELDSDRPRRSRHSRSKSRERSRSSPSRDRRRRSRSRDRSRESRRRRSRSRERRRRSRSRSRSPRHDRRRSRSREHGRNNADFKGSVKILSQSLKDAEDSVRRPAFNRPEEKKVESPEKIRQEQRRKQQQQQQQQEEEEAANLMEDYVPEELYVRPDQHAVMRPGGPLLPTPPGPPPLQGIHHMHPHLQLSQMPPQRDHGPLLPTPHDHPQPPEALMRPPNLHTAMHHQFQMMEQLPPGSRDPGQPPSAPPPQFVTVSEGNLRAVLTPQMQQLQMLQQNLRGVGRPPLLMNPVMPPPGAAFQGGIPRLGPPHWQALQPQAGSAILLPNRMQLQVSQPQSTIGIGQNGPEAPIMAFAPHGPPPVSMQLPQLPAELRARLMEAPPRLLGQMDMSSENTPPPPLPTVPDSLATPPPPLPARALQEMHQISQLLNAQQQGKQGDAEDLFPFHHSMPPPPPPADESRLFKVPRPPPPHPKPGQQPSLRSALETLFHRSSIEPDSSKLSDNTEAIDMDVSSPLSDEAPAVVFPPAAASAAAAHRNSEPRAPEKGVSFALPSTGEDDTVPSSAVELDNQQKRQQEFMKLNRKERVVEEVKLAIKPYYAKGKINKEQYKEIMRKAVPKICHSRSGDINPNRIRSYIESYVSKIRQAVKYEHKKQEPTSQSQDKAARKPTKQRHSKKPQKAK